MKQFEYKQFTLHRDPRAEQDELIGKLNQIGKEGWEVVHIVDSGEPCYIIAKREIIVKINLLVQNNTLPTFCTPEGSPLIDLK